VWRDFGNNVARSASKRPWMPALGNHECEFGTDTISGHPGEAPGGIAAQGAAGNYWNGPYGFGHYLSRFLLPDNGVTNWDGNRLRGNFYTFQVGTVTFISLDADDVIYQDGAANYVIDTANTPPETTTTGASIPNGTTTYTRFYTGGLKPDAKNNSLVPDYASGQPNLQTIWLERTLAQARRDPSERGLPPGLGRPALGGGGTQARAGRRCPGVRELQRSGRGVADRSRAVSSGPGRGSVHDPAQPDRPGRRAAGQHGGREPRRGLRPRDRAGPRGGPADPRHLG
jgi:hypothetical protein